MALVIAIAAVVVSVKQSETQTKIEILNKQPILLLELVKKETAEINGLSVKNIGFGPALIKSFIYYSNQQKYRQKLGHRKWPLIRGYTGTVYVGFDFSRMNNLEQDDIIKSDEKLFVIGTRDRFFPLSTPAEKLSKTIVEIEYRSLNLLDTTTYLLFKIL